MGPLLANWDILAIVLLISAHAVANTDSAPFTIQDHRHDSFVSGAALHNLRPEVNQAIDTSNNWQVCPSNNESTGTRIPSAIVATTHPAQPDSCAYFMASTLRLGPSEIARHAKVENAAISLCLVDMRRADRDVGQQPWLSSAECHIWKICSGGSKPCSLNGIMKARARGMKLTRTRRMKATSPQADQQELYGKAGMKEDVLHEQKEGGRNQGKYGNEEQQGQAGSARAARTIDEGYVKGTSTTGGEGTNDNKMDAGRVESSYARMVELLSCLCLCVGMAYVGLGTLSIWLVLCACCILHGEHTTVYTLVALCAMHIRVRWCGWAQVWTGVVKRECEEAYGVRVVFKGRRVKRVYVSHDESVRGGVRMMACHGGGSKEAGSGDRRKLKPLSADRLEKLLAGRSLSHDSINEMKPLPTFIQEMIIRACEARVNAHEQWKQREERQCQIIKESFGINCKAVIDTLKDLWLSVDDDAPMRVIPYKHFKAFGKLPRSSDNQTVKLEEIDEDSKLVFISHRWLRPWKTKEECNAHGHQWAGMAHPDDAAGSKYKLICAGIERLASEKGWDVDMVCVWLDFCGVEQDNVHLLGAGVGSLRGYISVCDAVLIPSPEMPAEGQRTVDKIGGDYGKRAWTRLESLSYYAVSVLKHDESPDIWVAAGEGCSFLERFDYVLTELPSNGEIFNEEEIPAIQGHEQVFIEALKESVKRNGYVVKHSREIVYLCFHPSDDKLIVSACSSSIVKFTDTQTGTVKLKLQVDGKGLDCAALNHDCKLLAASSWEHNFIQIWDLTGPTPTRKCTLTGQLGQTRCVAFSPDGTRLASGSDDKTVRIWDTATGKEMMEPMKGHSKNNASCICTHGDDSKYTLDPKCPVNGHTSTLSCVAWSPDGMYVASSSEDVTVRIWDVKTGQVAVALRGHSVDNPECTCSHTQNAYGHFDRVADKQCVVTGPSEPAGSLAFNRDGTCLARAGNDGTLMIWDISGGWTVLCTLSGNYSTEVVCVAWSPDGNYVACGLDNATVHIWDVTSGHEVSRPIMSGPSTCPAGHQLQEYVEEDKRHKCNVCRSEVLGQSGVMGCHACEWKVCNSDSCKQLGMESSKRLKCVLRGHSHDVKRVVWSNDGQYVASGSQHVCVDKWRIATHQEITASLVGLSTRHSCLHDLAWSPDGTQLASASEDTSLRIIDASSEDASIARQVLKGHTDAVHSVAWSPNERYLASGSRDNTVRIWDATISGCVKNQVTLHDALHVAEDIGYRQDARDGSQQQACMQPSQLLKCTLWGHSKENPACTCTHGDKRMKRCTGNVVRDYVADPKCAVRGHLNLVSCVAWSPNGQYVASASHDKTVRIWDLVKEQEAMQPLGGHSQDNPACTCSHDMDQEFGRLMCTADAECHVSGHFDLVVCVAWSPDGRYLVSGSEDKSVRIWDAKTGQELVALRGHSRDNPACTCNHYFPQVWFWYKADAECPVKGHSYPVRHVAWSPDGQYVASGYANKTVRIWDSKTWQEVASVKGSHVSWNATGQFIITAESDLVEVYKLMRSCGMALVAQYRSPSHIISLSTTFGKIGTGHADGMIRLIEAPMLQVQHKRAAEVQRERTAELHLE